MDKFLVVMKREYMERVRTKAFLLSTLLVPVFMTAVMLLPVLIAKRSRPSAAARSVVILDATRSGLGEIVAANLVADSTLGPASSRPTVRVVAPESLHVVESELVTQVQRRGGPTGFVVLDDSTLHGRRARYAGRNASSMLELDKVRTAIRQGVLMQRLRSEGMNPETVDNVTRMNLRMPAERITERGRGGSAQTGILVGAMISFLLYLSIILHGQNVLRGVLEEKTNRVAEVVLSSVKPDILLAGKVAGVGAVGLTQQAVWLGATAYLTTFLAPMILRNQSSLATNAGAADAATTAATAGALGGITMGGFAAILAFFLLGFLFYATLFAAAGAMVNSEQEAQQVTFPVMLPLVAAMVVMQPVILAPSSTLARVMSWLPFSSPIIMPMRMMVTDVSTLEVVGALVLGFASCLGIIWLAARIYRVGMLMYGKRPTLRELVRWVRVAG